MTDMIQFYGHAAFHLVLDEDHILIDPYLKGNPDAPVKPGSVEATHIVVTHGHGDHVGDTLEIAKRTNALVISNAEICDYFEAKGLRVHGMHLGGLLSNRDCL